MGGYNPRSREGLIALIAMRRATAEKLRREKLAAAKTPESAEVLAEAAQKARKSGWFRR